MENGNVLVPHSEFLRQRDELASLREFKKSILALQEALAGDQCDAVVAAGLRALDRLCQAK
jgi:hypothetical protein